MSLLRQSRTELVLLSLLIAALPRNDCASMVFFGVSGVAFDNGTSPPSPLLKERGDSPKEVLG